MLLEKAWKADGALNTKRKLIAIIQRALARKIIAKEKDIKEIADFFWNFLQKNKSYISHGEIQMGVAKNTNTLAKNGKVIWESYLENKIKDKNKKLLDEYIFNFIDEEYQYNTTRNYINSFLKA